MGRSYLFAPAHNAKLLNRVFGAEADAVMLDLEDAVPPDAKVTARAMVAEALLDHPAWVRVNAAKPLGVQRISPLWRIELLVSGSPRLNLWAMSSG